METSPDRNIEMPSPTPDIFKDHLQTIAWGPENYPVELLELHEDEAQILQQVDAGMSLKDISRAGGLNYDATNAKYHIAQGKLDARNGLCGDVTELSVWGKESLF